MLNVFIRIASMIYYFIEYRKDTPKFSQFTNWTGPMINLGGSNYACLEQIPKVPNMFKPFKYDLLCNVNLYRQPKGISIYNPVQIRKNILAYSAHIWKWNKAYCPFLLFFFFFFFSNTSYPPQKGQTTYIEEFMQDIGPDSPVNSPSSEVRS